ncbi:hypothetical protein MASR1M32_14880 [Rhodobacter sp.]
MRWLFRAVGALLLLVLLGLGLLAFVPSERIATAAAQQFEKLTGRALQIEGDVSPRFWPVLGVTTGPVTIANAEWSDQGPMLRAESLTIEFNASALLGARSAFLACGRNGRRFCWSAPRTGVRTGCSAAEVRPARSRPRRPGSGGPIRWKRG